MLLSALRVTRIGFRLTWLLGVVALVALAAGPAVLRLAGIESYTVRGGSMSPSVPLGAMVLVQQVPASDIAAGDVITFRAANDTVVTHRVLGRSAGSEPMFITKGDANPTPDPDMTPASAVIGRVALWVPFAGTAVVQLATGAGMLVAGALLVSLMVCGWFIDELRTTLVAAATRRATTEPAS